jgi:hypothetical protein
MTREEIRPVKLFSMKRAFVITAVTGALAVSGAVPAAASDVQTVNATCDLTASVAFDPALTQEPQQSRATSTAGTAKCTGTVDGEDIDAAVDGIFQADVALVDATCLAPNGSGTFTLTVTTVGGTTKEAVGTMDITVGESGFVVTGQVTGTGTVVPVEGDCVNTPVSLVSTEIAGAVFSIA